MNAINFYSKVAYFYDIIIAFLGHTRAVNFFIKQLPFKKHDVFSVLDVGCGTGLYSIAILKYFPHATVRAIDLSPEMIEKMKINIKQSDIENRVEISVDDVTDFRLTKTDFDLIITSGVLEYVSIKPVIKNLAAHLKQGGYFLNSPVKNNIIGYLLSLVCKFTVKSSQDYLLAFHEAGFLTWRQIKFSWNFFPICIVKSVSILKK